MAVRKLHIKEERDVTMGKRVLTYNELQLVKDEFYSMLDNGYVKGGLRGEYRTKGVCYDYQAPELKFSAWKYGGIDTPLGLLDNLKCAGASSDELNNIKFYLHKYSNKNYIMTTPFNKLARQSNNNSFSQVEIRQYRWLITNDDMLEILNIN